MRPETLRKRTQRHFDRIAVDLEKLKIFSGETFSVVDCQFDGMVDWFCRSVESHMRDLRKLMDEKVAGGDWKPAAE
jgi:hypothetical protein